MHQWLTKIGPRRLSMLFLRAPSDRLGPSAASLEPVLRNVGGASITIYTRNHNTVRPSVFLTFSKIYPIELVVIYQI